MNHTPGPWWIAPPIFDGDVIYARPQVKGRRNEVIAMGIGNKADASLIAAAPEMLELLRQAWLEMDNALLTYIPVGEDGEDMAELLGEIKTILDRIDGEEGTNA